MAENSLTKQPYYYIFQPFLWSRTFCNNSDCSQNLMQWFIYWHCCIIPNRQGRAF